jgi:predicted RNA-binding Zn ribbon-like protein
MTECQVIERLREASRDAGSVAAFARKAGLSLQYVHDVINGRRSPSERICQAIGIRKVTTTTFEERNDTL